MNKISYRIILFFSSLVVLALLFTSFILIKHNQSEVCGLETPHFVCGTPDLDLSESKNEGRIIFNINCAACHTLDRMMTGPALRDIVSTSDYPYTDFLFDFINKEDSLIQTKHLYTIRLNEEYDSTYNHNFRLTREEYDKLMEYLN